MLSLQGVVISYLYILYLIYQGQALSYLPNPCRHPVCHISCSYSTDSVTQFPSFGFRSRKHETFYKLGTLFLHCHNYVTALGETVSHQYQNVLAAEHSARVLLHKNCQIRELARQFFLFHTVCGSI